MNATATTPERPTPPAKGEPIIRVRGLEVGFGTKTIMKDLDLDVFPGEILGFVGGSGQGKSVLTRAILGLIPKRAGSIEVFGRDLDSLSDMERRAMERALGCAFFSRARCFPH